MNPTPSPERPEPKTPRKMWIDLKAQILTEIHEIDEIAEATNEFEPAWWLEMMETQRLLRRTL